MNLNKKGFTMVELLVSMAIMGLLIIMAFPTIRAIQANNNNTKYEEYGKSVISAAKLYIDSYGVDIFDPTKSSQKYQLNFDDLVKKDLIKDINISDSTCITGKSNVWIVKYNDDYSYCLHMSCKIKGTDDSAPPIYESIDKVGSCKEIANKVKTVKYIYNDGTNNNEYLDEVIEGDDNYRIVSTSRTGFNFNANHNVFLKWVDESGKEYNQNTIYDKKATGSTVFTAKTRKWEYYLYFIKNSDGTYGGSMTSSQKCSYGSSCKLTANGFTREGYTFKHWKNGSSSDTYTNEEDVKTKIGNKIPRDGARYDLTAIFRPNICSVKYNANGGTLQTNHGSTISQSGNKVLVSENEVHHKVEYGDKLGTSGLNDWNKKNYINLARKGYKINSGSEWNTKSDGSGTTFNQTSRYEGTTLCPNLKNGDQEVTMYAKWEKSQYTINLDQNGATDNGTTSTTVEYKGTPSTIKAPTRKYTINYYKNNTNAAIGKETDYANYTFDGWYTQKSGGTKIINSNGTLVANVSGYTDENGKWIKTSSETFYAHWSGGSVTTTSITKSGYTCKWYNNSSTTGTGINPNSTITPTSNTNLYAGCIGTTSPTCTLKLSGTAGDNGWYKSDVTVEFATKSSDVTSYNITTSTTPSYGSKNSVKQETDTRSIKYYGYVKNAAGKTGKCEKTFKMDKTPPTITVKPDTIGIHHYTCKKNDKCKRGYGYIIMTSTDTISGVATLERAKYAGKKAIYNGIAAASTTLQYTPNELIMSYSSYPNDRYESEYENVGGTKYREVYKCESDLFKICGNVIWKIRSRDEAGNETIYEKEVWVNQKKGAIDDNTDKCPDHFKK